MRSDNEREVGTHFLVARNGECHQEHVGSGRDGRGENGLGSGRSRNVKRLTSGGCNRRSAGVVQKDDRERDQGNACNELWNHSTEQRQGSDSEGGVP